MAQKIIDPRGRRAGVQLATAGYLIGSLVLVFADSVNVLIVGRSVMFHFREVFTHIYPDSSRDLLPALDSVSFLPSYLKSRL